MEFVWLYGMLTLGVVLGWCLSRLSGANGGS